MSGVLASKLGRLLIVGLVSVAVVPACTYETTGVAPELPAVAQTSRIMAADGTLLTTLQAEQNRDVVRLDDIPISFRDAVVAIEDDRFWLHRGIDLRAILRAARMNASVGGIAQGGSTITQQYVKTALLDPAQTVNRKLKEAMLAWRLERAYSKEVILERYLNTVYFGHGAYGAAAAAHEYFGKAVGQLTLAESALLAGLIRAPSTTNPFERIDLALQRRNVVLDRMMELDRIGRRDYDNAVNEPIHLAPEQTATERYPAAHFVEAVKQWILSDPHFGATDEDRRNLLFKGGLRITTTIDLKLQTAAEHAITQLLPEPDRYPEGSLVAVEPSTGHVVAMVGGRDYFGNSPFAKYNLALGEGRQAGSTFKPFVLAAALEQGIPLTRTYPAPAETQIPLGPDTSPWRVQNFGGTAGGTVSLTEATVWSYNTPYARLMLDVGPGPAVDMATRLGIQSPLQPLPSAVLGTENVTVLDMASAYATFANRGQHLTPVLVSRITRPDGAVLYEDRPHATTVLRTDLADQVNWVLRQVVQRGTGTGARLDRPTAGKTGTAEGYKDAWFVGYTPDLAAAVWVGFAQLQQPMVYPSTPIQVTGGSWPAQIWERFMSAATAEQPVVDFAEPEPTTLRKIEASRRVTTTLPPPETVTSSSTSTTSTTPATSTTQPTTAASTTAQETSTAKEATTAKETTTARETTSTSVVSTTRPSGAPAAGEQPAPGSGPPISATGLPDVSPPATGIPPTSTPAPTPTS
jgi:penicillin-binding protein 1A